MTPVLPTLTPKPKTAQENYRLISLTNAEAKFFNKIQSNYSTNCTKNIIYCGHNQIGWKERLV